MTSAKQTNVIVESLFPENVRDRLYGLAEQEGVDETIKSSKSLMRNMISEEYAEDPLLCENSATEPIADLFASATVGFLDIAGFTAWSSEREPSQVFRLLESIYQAFDTIANKLGVFKVETMFRGIRM